jgi:hypothetical protein
MRGLTPTEYTILSVRPRLTTASEDALVERLIAEGRVVQTGVVLVDGKERRSCKVTAAGKEAMRLHRIEREEVAV